MSINTIAFAIPGIFLLLGAEYYWSRKKKKDFFTFSSSVSNISIGIAERMTQLFFAGYFILLFNHIQKNYAFLEIQQSFLSWIILFLLTDFLWYWYHRLSHQINILWGAHIVHHQSEDFNLTVSLRITLFQAVVRLFFGLALPFIGFPVEMIAVTVSILGVYQFFIHTRAIHKLGILEDVLVTPSHHRVHHGSNEQYLDKNYGGVLIIWDRLFNTFQREEEEVTYGLTKQVGSSSFLWLHFHFWLTLKENMRYTPGILNKLKLLFVGPDKLNYDHEETIKQRFLSKNKKQSTISKDTYPQLYVYIRMQLALSLCLLFLIYLIDFSLAFRIISAIFILITLINCGAVLEQKRWVFPLEITRFLLIYTAAVLMMEISFLWICLPLVIFLLLKYYSFMQYHYFKVLYSQS